FITVCAEILLAHKNPEGPKSTGGDIRLVTHHLSSFWEQRALGMARTFIFILLLFVGLRGDSGEEARGRSKRDISNDQPRMISDGGHLIFSTGDHKDIRFLTTGSGTVRVGSENLTQLIGQIKTNKDDIANLKASGGVVPPEVTSQLNQLSSRVTTIESNVQTIEQTIQMKTCNSNPCQNGGTCLNLLDSFHCICPHNWQVSNQLQLVIGLHSPGPMNLDKQHTCGTAVDSIVIKVVVDDYVFAVVIQGPTCTADVNECQLYVGTTQGCQNGATCVNTAGSFTCTCSPEWYGTHCTSRYDDCALGSQNLCSHGLCIDSDRVTPNQVSPRKEGEICKIHREAVCCGVRVLQWVKLVRMPNYKCICDSGWMPPSGSPACTADIDECSLPNKPCSTNPPVSCFNTLGSFYCGACPAGWQGNGYSCLDVDECATNNGGCSTSPMVQCLNTMGSFHCGTCPPGYEGDGRTCTQLNLCATNNGGCHSLATCSAPPGSTIPICTCPPGYTGNGYGPTGCTQTSDVCQTSNPCVHGQCVSTTTGYICMCEAGWSGTNCNENVNECASNPCQNGGTCVDGVNGYTCTCTSQWTGPNCETAQQGVVHAYLHMLTLDMTLSFSACGGYLTGPAGTFSYPNTPGSDQYDHMVSCAWVIRVNANKHRTRGEPKRWSYGIFGMLLCLLDQIVRITFPHFDLEHSTGCSYDFLQIHDGESAGAHMLGRYCGTAAPAELLSSHNTMYFWFRSDHSINAGGFTVAWQEQTPGLSTHPKQLMSQYVLFRDGLLPEDPVLAKYCSTSSPPPLLTTGPSAWIHFHSDFSTSDLGFHITYTTSPSDPGCGGTYTDSEGIIISPNWPNNYAHNRQCIYVLRQPPNDAVALNFTNMDLEVYSGCAFDFVEVGLITLGPQVRDGLTETAPLVGKYCGSTLPAPIISSSNGLWVRFKSDTSISKAGFRAVYQVACGGTVSGLGQIRTPYHPNSYPHEKTCEWVINQPQGYVVTLAFLTFDIEQSSTCFFDYVELIRNHPQVRDGSTASSPLIGRYCGSRVPPMLQSTQQSMYIRFGTDASVSNHGFTAEYASAIEGCGATLNDPSGTVTSPGHPTNYPHGANCTWFISVAPGNIIRLTFTSFNLEYHFNCLYDYVEVYDNGTAETGTKLGRYCGRSVPPSLTSTDNLMTILFVSDVSMATEGFSANYVSINATTGTVSSTNP
ncbi:cubilin-like, partial [Scleropages formosus]